MISVVDTLKHLVRMPSTSALTNRPIIDYAEHALHSLHWRTRLHLYVDANNVEKINLIAAPPGQPLDEKNVDIAFVCHTDTVPYSASWPEALSPIERDGMICGCGACDVKAFLACLLTAAEEAQTQSLRSLRIVLTADEETGCIGAGHFIAQDLIRPANMIVGEPTGMQPARAGKGYCLARITVTGREAHSRPANMIVGEPTGMQPARAGKGYCLARITVTGREAHSAHPALGASAILGAAHLMVALEELAALIAQEENPLFSPGYTTINIGTVQGGTAKNIIPGECSFLLEWRPIPSAGAARIPDQIQQIMDRQQQLYPRLSYCFEITRQQAGFETQADSPLVRSLETLSGQPASSIPFGSEASLFAKICHNVVVFGPGDMQTAHSSRECVPIDQLQRAVHCLRALMLTNQ